VTSLSHLNTLPPHLTQSAHKMADSEREPEPKNFSPKKPVDLAEPKDDPITYEELAKCDGNDPSKPTLVAIKGTVFDVSKKRGLCAEGDVSCISRQRPLPRTRDLGTETR